MRVFQTVALASVFALCSASLLAQQLASTASASTPGPTSAMPFGPPRPSMPTPIPLASPNDKGATLLHQALTAVTGQALANDVTLQGNVTIFLSGGATETGSITLVAKGDTQSEVTTNLPKGTSAEVRSISTDQVPAEMRIAPNGTISHSPAWSVLTPHPAWFFPQFIFSAGQQSGMNSSFIASETRQGQDVEHLQVWQSPSASSSTSGRAEQERTRFDLYLDPTTSLPVAMVYWMQPVYQNDPPAKYIHKDNRVPVEIRFSEYVSVQGVPVARHVASFIQGRQVYDIEISSVAFNTGSVIPSVQ